MEMPRNLIKWWQLHNFNMDFELRFKEYEHVRILLSAFRELRNVGRVLKIRTDWSILDLINEVFKFQCYTEMGYVIVKWKRLGRNNSCSIVLSIAEPESGKTEKNHENLQSR